MLKHFAKPTQNDGAIVVWASTYEELQAKKATLLEEAVRLADTGDVDASLDVLFSIPE